MTMGLLFWILMILWGLSLLGGRLGFGDSPWFIAGSSVLHWILLGLLGWKVFGPILH